jgi:hypothetical protein
MTLTLTKARPEATSRAGGPSEALPEKLSPARARLTKVLLEYERALEDLSAFLGRVSRAQADIDQALGSKSFSEQEVMDRVSAGQSSKSAYESRAANREVACKLLLQQLEEAMSVGLSELSGLVIDEASRRRGVLAERVRAAGQLGADLSATELDVLLESYSRPVADIRKWGVDSQVLLLDGAEHKLRIAKEILAGYEGFFTEQRKQI